MGPGNPEASPGAEDGAGGRSAQTAEEGESWCFHCERGSVDFIFKLLKRAGSFYINIVQDYY